jgi:uncharacterized protein YjiS (DUF1127 family)
MLCELRQPALSMAPATRNHAVWSYFMSTGFNEAHALASGRRGLLARGPQSNSWQMLLRRWRCWTQRSRQRAALRDLADNKHLLDDLGLTSEEALDEANRPFWE